MPPVPANPAFPPQPATEAELTNGTALAQALESQEQKTQRLDRLEAIGQALAKTRSEAIQGRQQSGIEEDWHEDEEFYQGIDDANRNEHRSIWHTKPMGQASPMSGQATRSTVFPNITGPYCDAAAARIGDMLLPTDDRNFAIKPEPIPELIDLAKGNVSDDIKDAAAVQAQDQGGEAAQHIQTAVDAANAVIDRAKVQADKAQKRIDDWLVECQWHAQVRQVIEDSARIGTGVLKGPIPQMKKMVAYIQGALQVKQEIKPGSKRISAWNFFPDPACGEDVQNGAYTWERDRITKKQLRELKKQPAYIPEMIDLCLEEGPVTATADSSDLDQNTRSMSDAEKRAKYEIWYYHGTMERDDLVAAGVDVSGMDDPHLPALVTMVNNHVVRASLNPLDTGSYPYDVMVWRPRENHWAGIGVARQIRTPQRMVVAATRNLMDNAGLAAGPMIVLRQGQITPADGVVGLGPRKVYYLSEDADEVVDAKSAIGVVKIDMLVEELKSIIALGLKFAEDVTGMPLLLQGQSGKDTPDTVGGLAMLNHNASAVLRRLARLFDDRVTERHITRYYEWLLQYGKDDEKGSYLIDARGSSALVERDIQNQELTGILKLSLDMRFGLDPRKSVQEYLKSRHFDPKRFEFDDPKWQQILANMSKGPKDQAMAIAQLRAATEEKLAGFWAHQEQVQKQVEQQFEAEEAARDRALEMWVRELEDTGTKSVTLDEIKAKLAGETIRAEAENNRSSAMRGHETIKALSKQAQPAVADGTPKGVTVQ